MTAPDLAFEHWLRHRFPEINTALEELYFSAGKLLIKGGDAVESLQRSLVDEGRALIAAVLQDDSMPKDYEQGFHLLGNVGMYMAACRRHEVDMAPGAGESSLKEGIDSGRPSGRCPGGGAAFYGGAPWHRQSC